MNSINLKTRITIETKGGDLTKIFNNKKVPLSEAEIESLETFSAPHLIDEDYSDLLGDYLMQNKPEYFEIAYSLLNTGIFSPKDDSELQEIKTIVAGLNSYKGIQVDSVYKMKVLKLLNVS